MNRKSYIMFTTYESTDAQFVASCNFKYAIHYQCDKLNNLTYSL